MNEIVDLRQRNSTELSVNLLRYISRAREAKLEPQEVQKILESVNILNFPPPLHWWHSYCHFSNCFGTWGSDSIDLPTFFVSPSSGCFGLEVAVAAAA